MPYEFRHYLCFFSWKWLKFIIRGCCGNSRSFTPLFFLNQFSVMKKMLYNDVNCVRSFISSQSVTWPTIRFVEFGTCWHTIEHCVQFLYCCDHWWRCCCCFIFLLAVFLPQYGSNTTLLGWNLTLDAIGLNCTTLLPETLKGFWQILSGYGRRRWIFM